ncbi:hypothetical protein V6L77_14725 [Pannonibacter sp. Pt2-lr]
MPQTFVVIETAEGFQVLAPVEDDALSEDELDLVAGELLTAVSTVT